MFWKKKKQHKNIIEKSDFPLENKLYNFKTVKTEISINEIKIPTEDKSFPTKEMIQRVKPATYSKKISKLDIDPTAYKVEQTKYNESLKPTADIFEVEGWIEEHTAAIKAFRYSNVHSAIKNGKEIYDFGFDGSTLFNFIYVEEFNRLLGGDDYLRIYCTEENLPYAKKFIRNQLLKNLHIELTNIQLKIDSLKSI